MKEQKTFNPSMNYRYFTSSDKKNKGKPFENHQDFPCHNPHKRISSKGEYIVHLPLLPFSRSIHVDRSRWIVARSKLQ